MRYNHNQTCFEDSSKVLTSLVHNQFLKCIELEVKVIYNPKNEKDTYHK